MRDETLLHYERELTYLREMGAQFADKYPKIAARLMLEESKESEDPHVERLLEAFAFLAGRVHLKLDDDFPEITELDINPLIVHAQGKGARVADVRIALAADVHGP